MKSVVLIFYFPLRDTCTEVSCKSNKGHLIIKNDIQRYFCQGLTQPRSENILKSARLLPSKSLRQGGKKEAAVRDDKGWRDKEKTEGRRERTEERRRDMLKLSCVL